MTRVRASKSVGTASVSGGISSPLAIAAWLLVLGAGCGTLRGANAAPSDTPSATASTTLTSSHHTQPTPTHTATHSGATGTSTNSRSHFISSSGPGPHSTATPSYTTTTTNSISQSRLSTPSAMVPTLTKDATSTYTETRTVPIAETATAFSVTMRDLSTPTLHSLGATVTESRTAKETLTINTPRTKTVYIPPPTPTPEPTTALPPGEVRFAWSYADESNWGELLPPTTRTCSNGKAQSPIAIGLPPAASDITSSGGGGVTETLDTAPVRVINGFSTYFRNCKLSNAVSAKGLVYSIRRLQQTFTMTPQPNGVPMPTLVTNPTSAEPTNLTQVPTTDPWATGVPTTSSSPSSVLNNSTSNTANVCRMVRPDGSVWVLDYITPRTRGEHTLNGLTYAMSVDFVFKREATQTTSANGDTVLLPVGAPTQTIVSFLLTDLPESTTDGTDGTEEVPPSAQTYTPVVRSGTGIAAFISDAVRKLPEAYSEPLVYTNVNENLDLLDDTFSRKGFFSYGGSLTTPPCTQAVTWLVSPYVLRIQPLTATLFRDVNLRVFGATNSGLGGRAQRPLKASNGRTVLYFTGGEMGNAPYYEALKAAENRYFGNGAVTRSAVGFLVVALGVLALVL